MIALQINSLKNFMNRLLTGPEFDSFLLEEGTISTCNTITIDGHINLDFYASEPDEDGNRNITLPEEFRHEFRPWSTIKGMCFDLIKGKRTPLFFKFVLHCDPDLATRIMNSGETLIGYNNIVDADHVKALVLNIRFDGTNLVLTTGVSFNTFVMSKDPDRIWDEYVMRFLKKAEIEFSSL